jgi:hypothetical protein
VTNAQAALIAAATGAAWGKSATIARAERFKEWLDEQDANSEEQDEVVADFGG